MRLASVVAGAKALCDGGQQYQITAAEAEKKCKKFTDDRKSGNPLKVLYCIAGGGVKWRAWRSAIL